MSGQIGWRLKEPRRPRKHPTPWWINVRAHTEARPDAIHGNGWSQHAERFRFEFEARARFEELRELDLGELYAFATRRVGPVAVPADRELVGVQVAYGAQKVRDSVLLGRLPEGERRI